MADPGRVGGVGGGEGDGAPCPDLFSMVQRKVLTPNDFADLAEVEACLAAFERGYEQSAEPFEWKFTRTDLAKLLERLVDKPDYRTAA